MSATETRPLPTYEELRAVEGRLYGAYEALESIVLAIRSNVDEAQKTGTPTVVGHDYLGQLFEALTSVDVQFGQLRRERKELRGLAGELVGMRLDRAACRGSSDA